MERKHNLNLTSKQTYNLKDKDLGERSELLKVDEQVDKMLYDSAMLIQYLSNVINVTSVLRRWE